MTDSSDLFPADSLTPQKGVNAQSTLTAVMGAFEQHMREEGFAVNTIKSFSSDLRLFAQYLGAMQPIGEIGTEDLNKFLKWLVYERGIPCSPKSYARRVTTLKVLFGWLQEAGILLLNPAEAVVQMSVTSPLPTIPDDDQITQALAVTVAWRAGKQRRKADYRPHLLLTLLLQTGMKKGEVMGLTLNDIEADEHNPQLFIRYTNPRLRYKERKVAIDPEWLDWLDQYVAQYKIEEAIFTCTARNLEYVLRDVGDEAGLARGLLSFENLRWVSALTDLKNGMEPDIIREKLGLSKVAWRETKSKLERLWSRQKAASLEIDETQNV